MPFKFVSLITHHFKLYLSYFVRHRYTCVKRNQIRFKAWQICNAFGDQVTCADSSPQLRYSQGAGGGGHRQNSLEIDL